MVHNLTAFVSQVLPLQRLDRIYPFVDGGQQYQIAELSQLIRHAIVDGDEVDYVSNVATVIGIEGEVRDHLLLLRHATLSAPDAGQAANLKVLNSLVASFKPLAIENPKEELAKIRDEAGQKFQQFISWAGEDVFRNEFRMLMLRVMGWDLNDAARRNELVRLLRPFEQLSGQLKIESGELDQLWEGVHKAEAGDATELKQIIGEIQEEREQAQANQPGAQIEAGNRGD